MQHPFLKDTNAPSILQRPPHMCTSQADLCPSLPRNRISDPCVMNLRGVELLGGKKRDYSTGYRWTCFTNPLRVTPRMLQRVFGFASSVTSYRKAVLRCSAFTLPGVMDGGRVMGCWWFVVCLHGWCGITYDHTLVFFFSFLQTIVVRINSRGTGKHINTTVVKNMYVNIK